MIRLPVTIADALDSLSVPWELKQGSRHVKVMVRGQLAGIVPHKGGFDSDRRSILNIAAQIRRVGATGQPARRG